MSRRLLTLALMVIAISVVAVDVNAPPEPATAQSSPLDPLVPPSQPPPSQPAQPQPQPAQPQQEQPPPQPQHPPLPDDAGAGMGKRVVYSVSQQRVWLVEHDERVVNSWLVSGRKGIPKPGNYSVYARSRWSSAGKVRMEFMMRFAKPTRRQRQAIGFHAIPVDRRGRPIQSEDELGKPRSRGCVRQRRADAEHLWNWAPDGTPVRVTA